METIDLFSELVMKRRTIRGFKQDKDVPEQYVTRILDIARWAPSGANGQPWEFIVIRDASTRQKIVDLFLRQRELKTEAEKAIRGEVKMGGAGFRDAPVFILVLGDQRADLAYPVMTREEKSFQHLITGLASAGLLIQLAAAALGLGSQYVSDASSPYMAIMLKKYLGIPQPLKVYELIPIGYPKGDVAPPPRRALEEIVHYERYDESRARTEEDVRRFLLDVARLGAYGKGAKKEGRE
ncbi:MAG TPA: nitroreductase family protein [Syntrophorhabdales bacterium]|nr:nitroreductase family protein [Syntrophorhabdales bacterium]